MRLHSYSYMYECGHLHTISHSKVVYTVHIGIASSIMAIGSIQPVLQNM